jgi:hypothetical protein
MDILIVIGLFWFGAIFGSFAGAVAWRIKKKKDFVRGRSECEHCHHELAPLDLVPVFSWLGLRESSRETLTLRTSPECACASLSPSRDHQTNACVPQKQSLYRNRQGTLRLSRERCKC